jgi:hypothetical protein
MGATVRPLPSDTIGLKASHCVCHRNVAASPAIEALIGYAAAEATALLTANRDIVDALVSALIEAGELSGESVDEIISKCICARAVEAEKIRRHEWQARITNAKTFQQVVVQ